MVDELASFIGALPSTLGVLTLTLFWETPHDDLPQHMHDEIDGLLAMIPASHCPALKVLGVSLDDVSDLFRTTKPLIQLMGSCEELGIPLFLHEHEECHFGPDDPQELKDMRDFDCYLY